MNRTAYLQHNLPENISLLRNKELNNLNTYVEFLLFKNNIKTEKKTESPEGIWENPGFENINDLESEINLIRKEMSDSILSRKF